MIIRFFYQIFYQYREQHFPQMKDMFALNVFFSNQNANVPLRT